MQRNSSYYYSNANETFEHNSDNSYILYICNEFHNNDREVNTNYQIELLNTKTVEYQNRYITPYSYYTAQTLWTKKLTDR